METGRNGLGLIVTAIILTSCASAPNPSAPLLVAPATATVSQAPSPTTPSALIDIVATEDPSTDRWTVAYHFAHDVRGVAFVRGKRNHFRSASWTALADGGSKGVTWRVVHGHEELLASQNQRFHDLSISFPNDSSEKPSDYLLNASFSDGGRLFYTGHFALRLIDCDPDASCADDLDVDHVPSLSANDYRWTFRTAKNRHILLGDTRATEELDHVSSPIDPDQGTYVYFGEIEPRDTPFGRIVLDPGLPSWMIDSASTNVPLMLEWFAKDTGAPLSFKPLLFVSWGKGGSGRSSKGGGLPGLVQLAASGDAWSKDDPETRFHWLAFVAHEMFHMWNGDMFHYRSDPVETWLSEGSSEFFAARALLGLGLIDKAKFRREVLKQANACLMILGHRSLIDAQQNGTPEYACGATLLAWADAIAQDHGKTVGDLLGATFLEGQKTADHRYGTKELLEQIGKLDPDPKRLEPFKWVLYQGIADHTEELFAKELARPDFKVALGSAGKVMEHDMAYTNVGIELAHCDCDHRLNFWTRDTGLDFGESPQCQVLTKVRVVSVEGHAVPKDAGSAYQAILDRKMPKSLSVQLEGAKTPIKLTCRSDAPPPPFHELLY